ncbi:MAG TPA: hypothetical protein VE057_02380 [Archangium sp.]|nr:hypothetical protein [Archangium sp.]
MKTHKTRKMWLGVVLVAVVAAGFAQVEEPCRSEGTGCAEDVLDTTDVSLALKKQYTGRVAASGTSWVTHEFAISSPGTITATLGWTNASADLNLFLKAPSGETVAFANEGTPRPERVRFEARTPGTYQLGIKSTKGSTGYTLNATLATPGRTFPGRAPAGMLVWGASIEGNGDPVVRHESVAGHPLALRRTFWRWDQRTGGLVTTARDDLAHHRLPWVSVKTPSWAAMGAGQHDGEIDQLLLALKALPGPVWLTLHHEPEGGAGSNTPDDPAGPAGHVAMNRRVRQRMTALGVDNVALAPILMAHTWTQGSGRNPDAWWAPGIYDFLGVDIYNHGEGSLITDNWLRVRQWAAVRGVDVAVGEWGMHGSDTAAGQRVRAWYNHAAGSNVDGKGARVIGLSAFDSNLNSPEGGWMLQGAQLTVFHELLRDPRTADVVAR